MKQYYSFSSFRWVNGRYTFFHFHSVLVQSSGYNRTSQFHFDEAECIKTPCGNVKPFHITKVDRS
jgi:hypothetical protein